MRRQAIGGPPDDVHRTGHLLGHAGEVEGGDTSGGILLGRRVRAYDVGHAVQPRTLLPGVEHPVRARERHARTDAGLERRSAHDEVAAEAPTPQADATTVDVVACLEQVDDGPHGDLVVMPERQVVLGLALPGPIEREGRDAARQQRRLVRSGLLLRRVEPRHQQHHRWTLDLNGAPQHARERRVAERHEHPLPRRGQPREGAGVQLDGALVGRTHLHHVLHEEELAVVVAERTGRIVLTGADETALSLGSLPELRVELTALAPRRAPVVIRGQVARDLSEVTRRDAVRGESPTPMRDGRRDPRVDIRSCVAHEIPLPHPPSTSTNQSATCGRYR